MEDRERHPQAVPKPTSKGPAKVPPRPFCVELRAAARSALILGAVLAMLGAAAGCVQLHGPRERYFAQRDHAAEPLPGDRAVRLSWWPTRVEPGGSMVALGLAGLQEP